MKRISQNPGRFTLNSTPGESRRSVLYVEDDEDNREVASLRLERKYDLTFATNDREACEAFIKYGATLSMILMDIELQGSLLNGLDLVRLARGTLERSTIPSYAAAVPKLTTPIVFVTAYGGLYRREELLAAGGDDVIEKPVDFVELNSAMTRAHLRKLA